MMDMPCKMAPGEILAVIETSRSPSFEDAPCDSSRSFVDCGSKDQEVVQFEGASISAGTVKYRPKAFLR